MAPRVSVLLTSYGPAPYLPEAVSSAFRQRGDAPTFEVVVLSDRPRSARELVGPDGRVPPELRVVEVPEPQKGRFFAAGIQACAGEIVALLNDDDVWMPTRLASAGAALLPHPQIGLQKTAVEFFGEGLTTPPGRHRLVGIRHGDPNVLRREGGRWPARLGRYDLAFNDSSLTLRRDVLVRGLPYLVRIDASEDTFFLFLTLACSEGLAVDPTPQVRYRVHAQNSSGTGSGERLEALERTHREWVRRLETYQVIQEMVAKIAPDREDVSMLAHRGVRLGEFMSAFTAPTATRRILGVDTLGLLEVASSYAPSLDLAVVGLGGMSLFSQRFAQRAFLQWGT